MFDQSRKNPVKKRDSGKIVLKNKILQFVKLHCNIRNIFIIA